MFKFFNKVFVEKMNKAFTDIYFNNKGKGFDENLETMISGFRAIYNGEGTIDDRFKVEKELLNLCGDGYISGEDYFNICNMMKKFCDIKGLKK